ncbi:MAG TPA: hypothetical protein DCZ10_04155 [Pelotomaculum sp.]|nr:hypothetical protein [Pelotomaculum sp.]
MYNLLIHGGDIVGIIYYFWSFIRPVIKRTNGNISLLIRGIGFEGRSEKDLLSQIESYCNYLREKLRSDVQNAAIMQNAGNIHGKWNLGISNMNNTRKTLEALETFYDKGSFE